MTIISKMRVLGERMEDVTVMDKILWSMMPKFNYMVCSIEESKDLEYISIEELQGSLLVHEQKKELARQKGAIATILDQQQFQGRSRGNKGRGNQQ